VRLLVYRGVGEAVFLDWVIFTGRLLHNSAVVCRYLSQPKLARSVYYGLILLLLKLLDSCYWLWKFVQHFVDYNTFYRRSTTAWIQPSYNWSHCGSCSSVRPSVCLLVIAQKRKNLGLPKKANFVVKVVYVEVENIGIQSTAKTWWSSPTWCQFMVKKSKINAERWKLYTFGD